MSNEPRILVEFTPDEITWLADRLHEEWLRGLKAGAIATGDNADKVKAHQDMQNTLRNRILDKASDQGFGNL